MDLKNYIDRNFINIRLKDRGYASFAARKSILNAINELKTKAKGSVLDVGCGIMPYRDYLCENGLIEKYIGIDIELTDYHYKLKPDYFWNGKEIPFDDDSFDWIIATEFLEHYHETHEILFEISRVLKKGGVLFFTVPFVWPLHDTPYDEYRFTPYSLEKHFRKASFSEIELKPLGDINSSMAIVTGHWINSFSQSKYKKRIIEIIYKPLFNYLMKRSSNKVSFEDGQLPSGIYGFIKK